MLTHALVVKASGDLMDCEPVPSEFKHRHMSTIAETIIASTTGNNDAKG
jgi:hypothetical protein